MRLIRRRKIQNQQSMTAGNLLCEVNVVVFATDIKINLNMCLCLVNIINIDRRH
jgi:hypothetical protein